MTQPPSFVTVAEEKLKPVCWGLEALQGEKKRVAEGGAAAEMKGRRGRKILSHWRMSRRILLEGEVIG